MATTKLLTAKQVEQFLQVSRSTVDLMVRTGQLTVIKIGGSNRYNPEELQQITGVCPTLN